ncbi:5'/3'-nucleotidase SurE [Muribaculum sp.]|uniref:5'/3'-nucleotidase SurE n=1 Tax=Muribaculum sp. TaxID=1918611 RepID=UPI0023BC9AD1|nr:5'/3'-nucleotidase SurE [Muribaculum sp.]MDE5706149.1 5'/3'-nucleotidase SurE [Muribaculum sp.]
MNNINKDKLPVILVSNDDGINAPGIHRLIDYVAGRGRIIAVAPDGPRSGQSSALTVNSPLRITRLPDYNGAEMYSVNGTPVDCVKLAVHVVLGDKRPDILLSGINHGSNSAINALYSGTMGAVFEGCLLGADSIGFSYHSHDENASLAACAPVVDEVVTRVIENGLPKGVCLNVNIPKCDKVAGIKIARAAEGYWTEEYAEYTDPHNRPYYWLTGRFHNTEPDASDTDLYWTDRGYASVVPCRPDQTAYADMSAIKSLFED